MLTVPTIPEIALLRAVLTLLVLACAGASSPAFAHASGHQHSHPASAAAGALAAGEIRKVDKAKGRLVIKHGRIENLDMPPMTMGFQVKDPAVLDQVKAGDHVHFRAEKIGGAYTVTELRPAR